MCCYGQWYVHMKIVYNFWAGEMNKVWDLFSVTRKSCTHESSLTPYFNPEPVFTKKSSLYASLFNLYATPEPVFTKRSSPVCIFAQSICYTPDPVFSPGKVSPIAWIHILTLSLNSQRKVPFFYASSFTLYVLLLSLYSPGQVPFASPLSLFVLPPS